MRTDFRFVLAVAPAAFAFALLAGTGCSGDTTSAGDAGAAGNQDAASDAATSLDANATTDSQAPGDGGCVLGSPGGGGATCASAADCPPGDVCSRTYNKGTGEPDPPVCGVGLAQPYPTQLCKVTCECITPGQTCADGICN